VSWLIERFACMRRHRPFYCSNTDKTQCVEFTSILRSEAEDLFLSGSVDLVLTAHEHNMEATYPVYQGNVTQTNFNSPKGFASNAGSFVDYLSRRFCLLAMFAAPVYVVNGAGGNREGNDMPAGAAWTAFRSSAVGFGYITVAGPHSLTYDFVAANGTTLYSFEITK
jgi:hypothetical protein